MAKPKMGRSTRAANGKRTVLAANGNPTAMKRKGSYLARHFSPNSPGAMTKPNGQPSKRALAAKDWGEAIPKNSKDKAKLYAKGKRMLKRAKGK